MGTAIPPYDDTSRSLFQAAKSERRKGINYRDIVSVVQSFDEFEYLEGFSGLG